MRILALNSGSSSVKFQLFETGEDERWLVRGLVDGIGSDSVFIREEKAGGAVVERQLGRRNHHQAIETILEDAQVSELDGIGHRVVHGGEHYTAPVLIDEDVEKRIEECCALAPLHNPHNLSGYRAVRDVAPGKPNVAVFDTAFHQTAPQKAYLLGLPYELYTEQKIRRYGFHGTSHRYVSLRFADIKGVRPEDLKVIVCHLGSGSSACAVDRGRSVDTSMGFTPLDGLMMGTRPGMLDPGVLLHLMAAHGMDADQLAKMLNHRSGLMGISGLSGDMRTVLAAREAGHERARAAIDVYCYRIKKFIGSMFAALNGADAVLFTGGIGENSPLIRAKSCEALEALGIEVDPEKNAAALGGERCISSGRTEVWVVPTNEELLIARETRAVVSRR